MIQIDPHKLAGARWAYVQKHNLSRKRRRERRELVISVTFKENEICIITEETEIRIEY